MIIKPLTRRLFQKENIRQVVREWFEERKETDIGDRERFTKEVIEHNIEWFEALYMKALTNFVTDTKKFYISKVCYNNILNGCEDTLTEEYVKLLQVRVKNLFLGEINEKTHKLNYTFERYLCTKTIDGLFYEGEVYKYFKFWNKGIYGYRVKFADDKRSAKKVETEEFNLVPQEGNKHLVVEQTNFKKI